MCDHADVLCVAVSVYSCITESGARPSGQPATAMSRRSRSRRPPPSSCGRPCCPPPVDNRRSREDRSGTGDLDVEDPAGAHTGHNEYLSLYLYCLIFYYICYIDVVFFSIYIFYFIVYIIFIYIMVLTSHTTFMQ